MYSNQFMMFSRILIAIGNTTASSTATSKKTDFTKHSTQTMETNRITSIITYTISNGMTSTPSNIVTFSSPVLLSSGSTTSSMGPTIHASVSTIITNMINITKSSITSNMSHMTSRNTFTGLNSKFTSHLATESSTQTFSSVSLDSITVSPSPDHHFEQNQQLVIIMPLIIVLSCVFIAVIVIVAVVYCRRRNNQPAHADNVNDMLLQHNEIEMQEYPAFLSIEETER